MLAYQEWSVGPSSLWLCINTIPQILRNLTLFIRLNPEPRQERAN